MLAKKSSTMLKDFFRQRRWMFLCLEALPLRLRFRTHVALLLSSGLLAAPHTGHGRRRGDQGFDHTLLCAGRHWHGDREPRDSSRMPAFVITDAGVVVIRQPGFAVAGLGPTSVSVRLTDQPVVKVISVTPRRSRVRPAGVPEG